MMSRPLVDNQTRNLFLIAASLLALHALVLFLVLPHFEARLGQYYGVRFADAYDLIAKNLSAGYGYRFSPDTAPTLTREPGYPLLLAGLFKLFGPSIEAVRAANLLLAFIAAALTVQLARMASCDYKAQVAALALLLLHPGLLAVEARSGVEMPYIVCILLFLVSLQSAVLNERISAFVISGALLGMTCTVRSTLLLFPLLVPIYLLWARPEWTIKKTLGFSALLALTCALVMVPWTLRNYELVGKVIPTASVQGIAAHAGQYICEHLDSYDEFQALDTEASNKRAKMAAAQGYRFQSHYYLYFYDAKDEVSFNSGLNSAVWQRYKQNPVLFARCITQNVFNFWFAGKNLTATLTNVLIQVPYVLLAIFGAWAAVRGKKNSTLGLLALFGAYSVAVYLPIHAQARYGVPLIPLLAIFSAVGMSCWWRRKSDGPALPLPNAPS